jgi:hypothetical protein
MMDSNKGVKDVKESAALKDGTTSSSLYEGSYGDKQAMKLAQASSKLGASDNHLPSVDMFDSTAIGNSAIKAAGVPDKQSQVALDGKGFDPRASADASGLNRTGGEGRRSDSAQAADDRAKTAGRDDQAKAKEQAQREQEQRDREQKDRERKVEEQRDRDQKEKDQSDKGQKDSDGKAKSESSKTSDDQKKDNEKKGKDGNSGTPNPDSERPQLSAAELQAARNEVSQRIGQGLTNPGKPGADGKYSGAPNFGTSRSIERTGNPVPNNDGNVNQQGAAGNQRPIPKVDVSRG